VVDVPGGCVSAPLFVTEVDGSAAGFIQRYLVKDDPGGWADVLRATGTPGVDTAFGVDYLIGDPGLTGRGIGSAAIAEFTQLAFECYPEADSALVAVCRTLRRRTGLPLPHSPAKLSLGPYFLARTSTILRS
jgi:hypothetical protein